MCITDGRRLQDVQRTVTSLLGTIEPENEDRLKSSSEGLSQYDVADSLIARLGPALLYWHHYNESGARIETQTEPTDPIAVNFLKLLKRSNDKPDALFVRVLDISMILYAEHEFAGEALFFLGFFNFCPPVSLSCVARRVSLLRHHISCSAHTHTHRDTQWHLWPS